MTFAGDGTFADVGAFSMGPPCAAAAGVDEATHVETIRITLTEKLTAVWVGLVEMLPQIAGALIVLLLTACAAYILRSVFRRLFFRSRLRQSLQKLFVTVFQTIVWIGGTLVAATLLFPSLTPAKLLTALGLGTIAVGLAFKDIFENYIAGVMIMLRKPMRIGDYIECESVSGYVEDISVRDTYLRRTTDELIMLPNAFLYKNPVTVVTDRDRRRHEIVCGVAYHVDLEAARRVIADAVGSVDAVDASRPVDVFAREFNSSSMDFTVRWWASAKPRDMHESRDAVIRAVKRALDNADMEIPFPQRTLSFATPLPLRREKTYDDYGE